jgi:hypothetical protein
LTGVFDAIRKTCFTPIVKLLRRRRQTIFEHVPRGVACIITLEDLDNINVHH